MRTVKTWRLRPDLLPLLKQAKQLFPKLLAHVRPERVLLVSFTSRFSTHMACIRPNRNPWALALPTYDYAIEFWATRFDELDHANQLYVMVHELLHVPPTGFAAGVHGHRKTVDHDLHDFTLLRRHYGLNLESVQDILKGEKALQQRHVEAAAPVD